MADRRSLEAFANGCGGRLHFGFPRWLTPVVGGGTIAITLGRHVFLSRELLERAEGEVVATVRHELEHVRQFRRLGIPRFLWRYVSEYLRNRRSGLSPHESYLRIGLEAEARLAESEPDPEREARTGMA